MVNIRIDRASAADASGIVGVLKVVVAERVHSTIERVWTVEQEAHYLESLSPREALHIAVDATDGIVGFQSLDLWSPFVSSMAHVGQLGTFLLPEWRGKVWADNCGVSPSPLPVREAIARLLFRFVHRIPPLRRSI